MDYKKKYNKAMFTLQEIEKAFNERKDPDDFCNTLSRILKSIKI